MFFANSPDNYQIGKHVAKHVTLDPEYMKELKKQLRIYQARGRHMYNHKGGRKRGNPRRSTFRLKVIDITVKDDETLVIHR